jgi:hypothetical protein
MLRDPSATPPTPASPHRHALRRTVISGLALLAVGLQVGCGSTSDDSSFSAGAGAESSTSTSAPKAPQRDKAAEQKIVDGAQLRLSDFPSGWERSDDDSDSSDSPCDGIQQAKESTTAHGAGANFGHGDTTAATSAVYLYVDEGAAHTAFHQLTDSGTRVCIGKTFGEGIEKESKSKGPGQSDSADVGKPTTGQLSMDPLGDERSAGRVTVPISAQGINVDLILDLVFVRAGRGIGIMIYIDAFSPFDDGLRADLTGKVVRRLTVGVT